MPLPGRRRKAIKIDTARMKVSFQFKDQIGEVICDPWHLVETRRYVDRYEDAYPGRLLVIPQRTLDAGAWLFKS